MSTKLFIVCLLLCMCSLAHAQDGHGWLYIEIVDASGTKVTSANVSFRCSNSFEFDASGSSSAAIPVPDESKCDLTIKAVGYQPISYKAIRLSGEHPYKLKAVLAVGDAAAPEENRDYVVKELPGSSFGYVIDARTPTPQSASNPLELRKYVDPALPDGQSGSRSLVDTTVCPGGNVSLVNKGPNTTAAQGVCLSSTNLVELAARHNWEFGAFVQGGIGLQDRSNFGFLTAGAHLGRVLSDEHLSGALRGNFEYAVEAMPFWQSYTPKFNRILCPAGAVIAAQCSAPYTVGGTFTGFSVTPIILRWNFTHGTRIMPFVQGAGGVLYTTRMYPSIGNLDPTDPTQTGPNADTSRINFTPQGGVGLHYFLRDRRSLDLGLNAVHISSASLGDKNPGVNSSLQFSLGYTWWK